MTAPHDFFRFKNGVLHAEGVPVPKIVESVGTPAYIYSAEAFLTPLRELQEGLAGLPHTICFAVKANSNVAVLRLLSEAGAGMDLVSGGELFRAAHAGVPGDRIVFSGVGKTPAEMAEALGYQGKGILSFNVESVEELETLNSVAEHCGAEAPVALRFNPDVDPKTHPYISTGMKKNKFGLQKSEILSIIRDRAKYPRIRFKGLSCHIGSQLTSLSPLNDSFDRIVKLVQQLDRLLPEPISYVDLGGGVGITYKNEKPPAIAKYCQLIHKHFGKRSKLGRTMHVVIEPGRLLSGNSGILVTEVIFRKERGAKDFLIVDAAMNDLLRPTLYDAYHGISPVDQKHTKGAMKSTDVVGPVCETGDKFAEGRKLSKKLSRGDLVAILSAGAYGFVMSGNYNSRPRPPEILVKGDSFGTIRPRETYADLIRGESL